MMTGWCLWRGLSLVLDGEGQAGGKFGRRKTLEKKLMTEP